MEPLSKYSPVMLHLSPATRILNKTLLDTQMLGQNVRLVFIQERASHLWDVSWYNTRKHCMYRSIEYEELSGVFIPDWCFY